MQIDTMITNSAAMFAWDFNPSTFEYNNSFECAIDELADWIEASGYDQDIAAFGSLDYDGEHLCYVVPPLPEVYDKADTLNGGAITRHFLESKGIAIL